MLACICTLLVLGFTILETGADQSCISRKYEFASVVCVCNATYCDEISKIEPLGEGNYVIYHSSLDGARFEKNVGLMDKKIRPSPIFKNKDGIDWIKNDTPALKGTGNATLQIDRNRQFQTIYGFGGSFTDATGVNLDKLSIATQENFVKAYFSENGIEYNLGRVPIAGTDFSTRPYAYNELPENDINLSNFSLSMEDYNYKIPLIKKAQAVATDDIYLVASAWSPPAWMKSNKAIGGASKLIKEYYRTWANYHLRFLEEYDDNNITFWSVTTGNEPSLGIIPIQQFNSLGWMPKEQAQWLANYLGPIINGSKFSHLKIIALDDQRFSLPWWIEWMAENKDALKYMDGIATHWYVDSVFPPNLLDKTHELFPDKFLMATEACIGSRDEEINKVELGSWTRAERYINNIMEDLNHWYTGWIDWNLILDTQGGPNWSKNYVDAAIIALSENDEFLKQPIFYGMGHFSKFIPRGSKRVFVETITGNIDNVAFLRPDGGIAVIFYNPYDGQRTVTVEETGKGLIDIDVPPRSVHSLIYW